MSFATNLDDLVSRLEAVRFEDVHRQEEIIRLLTEIRDLLRERR